MLTDLVAIFHVTLEDADYVISVQASISVFLQSHCVTENQWNGSSTSPRLDGVSAKLESGHEK